MPDIANPPPYEETIAFLRNAPPPGEYSKRETAKRQAARMKPPILGSAAWVEAVRAGAFINRPPVPWEPPPKKPTPPKPLRWEPAHDAKFNSEVRKLQPGPKIPLDMLEMPLAKYHGRPCCYCHQPMYMGTPKHPTREHVIPRWMGGPKGGTNRLIVCRRCNGDKGGKTLREFVRWLSERNDPRCEIVDALTDKLFPNGDA